MNLLRMFRIAYFPVLAALLVVLFFSPQSLASEKNTIDDERSVARLWNEALLTAIRTDYARPTVHARNLFHTSVVMYDAWSAYDEVATPYLLGKTVGEYSCPFNPASFPVAVDKEKSRREAISYAAYRLLSHRFKSLPGIENPQLAFDRFLAEFGYDASITSTDYSSGSAAALGNYIAKCMIEFGLQDGSNEDHAYVPLAYRPVNSYLAPGLPGNPDIQDPNRWQPLALDKYIDQSGHAFPSGAAEFIGPEWGGVVPFALKKEDAKTFKRKGFDYRVYHDPGAPPQLNPKTGGGGSDEYKWNFSLVSIWSSHLDASDGVMWDISPGAMGNLQSLPTTFAEVQRFYNLKQGGDIGEGHAINPRTGQPYKPNMVPRGDYGRVLAEFWADGPDSETPPGHWFVILNYVNDHPAMIKKFRGKGALMDDLEWDVKSYFSLGGAVHDAAISAWGIKGWYDYVRPISAIRFMADRGQSSEPDQPRYSPAGIPLQPGLVELVTDDDPLAGVNKENVDKIKLYAWRGPDWVKDPKQDVAGVGWILAENWWPYQRPSFVTPPFAGYVSGHSTYSRAAAEVLTRLTGDPFFPGGMGEFPAKKDDFLVFEKGPSVDVVLQWATYRDASDQCSLSRIWGGIHPPADDYPGRLIGIQVGNDAFDLALQYFSGQL